MCVNAEKLGQHTRVDQTHADPEAQQQIGCNLCVYVSCVCVNAEELGQRTRVDREAQHQMSSILQAGEEDAQRRIEDGYREASQAVSTAL